MYLLACIPAYNEEKNIAKIIINSKEFADQIIVCDDGSTDSTVAIAESLGAIVIKHPKNLGYGSAIHSIFLKAKEINADKLDLSYRNSNLIDTDIVTSAQFKISYGEIKYIEEKINLIKLQRDKKQPLKEKTSGSTFKNPINQTNKKVWELIKESISLDTEFGDAAISKKHCNFFINKNNAKYDDMKKLINLVKDNVMSKTGIKLDLEIILVE